MALVGWILNSFKIQKANLLVSHLFHASAQVTECPLIKTSFQSHCLRLRGWLPISLYCTEFCFNRQQADPPSCPPPPYQTWRLFENAILTSTGFVYHFLTGWSFLMKRALHFATKLNSRDFHSKLFSSDLFVSSRKAVFPSPMASGVHRLRNTWSSLWEVICHKKKFNSPFWTNVWTP